VELSRGDDFGQFLHICRLYINDVEALVLDIEIPQIDPEIVTADEGFAIAIDRNAVDVISMGICEGSSRNSGYNRIMMGHPWELQLRGICEVNMVWAWGTTASDTPWG